MPTATRNHRRAALSGRECALGDCDRHTPRYDRPWCRPCWEMLGRPNAAEYARRMRRTAPAAHVVIEPEWEASNDALLSLLEYRERYERQHRLTSRQALSDQALEEIARVRPATMVELAAVPGVSVSCLRRHGASIIAMMNPPPEYSSNQAALSRAHRRHEASRRLPDMF